MARIIDDWHQLSTVNLDIVGSTQTLTPGNMRLVGNFSDRLVQARKAKGLSQKALAKAAGVKESTVSRHSRGGRMNVRAEIVQRYARALDVRVEWLTDGTGPMKADEEKPVNPVEAALEEFAWDKEQPPVTPDEAIYVHEAMRAEKLLEGLSKGYLLTRIPHYIEEYRRKRPLPPLDEKLKEKLKREAEKVASGRLQSDIPEAPPPPRRARDGTNDGPGGAGTRKRTKG